MKTLIVSDLHLADVWDEAKAQYLERLFSSAENIILNGDFWDGERIYFPAFLQSKWSRLFPLLKAKNAVYIYGNHDEAIYCDERTSLFSVQQAHRHRITFETYSCHVEHGHQLFRTLDIALHLPRFALFGLNHIIQPTEGFLVRHGSPQNALTRISNKVMKKRMNIHDPNTWYVCGHTHFPELDTHMRYANSGFIQFGKATYLIASPEGISLHTETY